MDTRVCILKSRRFPLNAAVVGDGGSLNVLRLVDELLRRNIRVDAFTRREVGEAPYLRRGPLHLYRVDYAASQAHDASVRDLEEGRSFTSGVLRHPEFDPSAYSCLHTHHWTSAIDLAQALPESLNWIHTPHLLAHHKSEFTERPFPAHILEAERELLRRATSVIALSRYEQGAIARLRGSTPEEVSLIYNGVDQAFLALRRPPRQRRSSLRLVTTGRICRQKGIDVLLDAAESLVAKGERLTLAIVGGTYNEREYELDIERRVALSTLTKRVRLMGHVPHAAVPGVLRSSDVYVQASRYESQGIALLEAMGAGLPVIASDLPAIREYVTDGRTGLLFDTATDPAEGIAERVGRLRDPEVRTRLGRAGRMTAGAFTWSRTIESTLQLMFRQVEQHQ